LIENFKDTKISKYEDILKKIVVIWNILEKDNWDTITNIVWNQKIWIIIPESEVDFKDRLKELENLLFEEEQFLNWIRKLLSSPGFRQNANENVIKQKETKKEEIEAKILKIKEEISKLKIKLK
jgi:valyl-tRNA synthetase